MHAELLKIDQAICHHTLKMSSERDSREFIGYLLQKPQNVEYEYLNDRTAS